MIATRRFYVDVAGAAAEVAVVLGFALHESFSIRLKTLYSSITGTFWRRLLNAKPETRFFWLATSSLTQRGGVVGSGRLKTGRLKTGRFGMECFSTLGFEDIVDVVPNNSV
jgi:hypothetical protein